VQGTLSAEYPHKSLSNRNLNFCKVLHTTNDNLENNAGESEKIYPGSTILTKSRIKEIQQSFSY